MNKNCVKSRFFKLIASYGVLEEFASILDQLLAVFLLSTYLQQQNEQWTQDNNKMELNISNGVDKQKLPKRGLKTLASSHKKHFQKNKRKSLKNQITQLLFSCCNL